MANMEDLRRRGVPHVAIVDQYGEVADLSSAPETVTLLTAAAATGSSVAISSGRYNWVAWGTWDGATAQLQFSPDNSTWIDVDGVLETANGGWSDIAIGDGYVRTTIASAGGTTSINARLLEVE